MTERGRFTNALALTGTVLVSLPILAPLVFSVVRTAQTARFRFDYLMPAELFPVALVGGALLLWAAMRARSTLRPIAWSFAMATGSLVASMVVATVTGLASGATEPEGWRLILVVALLAAYTLSLLILAVSGALLCRALLRSGRS